MNLLSKILLGVVSVFSLSIADHKVIYVDANSQNLKNIISGENEYKEETNKELDKLDAIKANIGKIEENNCELKKVKKILAKIIKNKNVCPNSNLKKHSQYSQNNLKKIPLNETNNLKHCKKTNNCPEFDITQSYLPFNDEKEFTVIVSANTYEIPKLYTKPNGKLIKHFKFKSSMYTKGGWIYNDKDNNWVKGYKLEPKIINMTPEGDIIKWANCLSKKGELK